MVRPRFEQTTWAAPNSAGDGCASLAGAMGDGCASPAVGAAQKQNEGGALLSRASAAKF